MVNFYVDDNDQSDEDPVIRIAYRVMVKAVADVTHNNGFATDAAKFIVDRPDILNLMGIPKSKIREFIKTQCEPHLSATS